MHIVLDELDLVLIMTVNPGFGGQSLVESALDKITVVREEIERRGLNTLVEVDGGVKASRYPETTIWEGPFTAATEARSPRAHDAHAVEEPRAPASRCGQLWLRRHKRPRGLRGAAAPPRDPNQSSPHYRCSIGTHRARFDAARHTPRRACQGAPGARPTVARAWSARC